MIYFLLFLFELILLFVLSKKLINSLAGIIYRFTKSHQVVVHTLAIIFLPGTIIHELAHLLFAGIMLVPVGELSVIPEIEGKSVKLGSLQIGKVDPLRMMIVGVAPIILGMTLIFSIFLFIQIGISPWWQIALVLYLLFQIGNTMFSSKKDVEGSILFISLILILSLVIIVPIYFLYPTVLQNIWQNVLKIDWSFIVNFSKQAAIYLIVPLVLDLLIILLAKPFSKH